MEKGNDMKGVLVFIVKFIEEGRMNSINLPALLVVLTVLFVAFVICIAISKKNKLYIKPKKQEKVLELHTKNEVA